MSVADWVVQSTRSQKWLTFLTSLAIGLWATGACWVMAIVAYLVGAKTAIVEPLIIVGAVTDVVEWLLRRKL